MEDPLHVNKDSNQITSSKFIWPLLVSAGPYKLDGGWEVMEEEHSNILLILLTIFFLQKNKNYLQNALECAKNREMQ